MDSDQAVRSADLRGVLSFLKLRYAALLNATDGSPEKAAYRDALESAEREIEWRFSQLVVPPHQVFGATGVGLPAGGRAPEYVVALLDLCDRFGLTADHYRAMLVAAASVPAAPPPAPEPERAATDPELRQLVRAVVREAAQAAIELADEDEGMLCGNTSDWLMENRFRITDIVEQGAFEDEEDDGPVDRLLRAMERGGEPERDGAAAMREALERHVGEDLRTLLTHFNAIHEHTELLEKEGRVKSGSLARIKAHAAHGRSLAEAGTERLRAALNAEVPHAE